MKNNNYSPKDSYDFKIAALDKLKDNWLNAIFVCIIFTLLTNGLNLTLETTHFINYGFHGSGRTNLGSLLNLILGGPLTLGLVTYLLNLFRDNNSKIEDVFSGFSSFGKSFVLNLLISIFVFLWTLLLIIPGIIASINYSMSFYILHDNPELSATQALNKSKEMMDGNKLRLFKLWLSFLGWFILGIISFGIGFIWITPYYNAALTAFYEDLKIKEGV
ncbi:DUF975 family protein [Haloimpatiens sp. FM7330]|uniref:DUF975 family protein n=1 Tax=Haloimpatiens sp. FM7330 TaxID=3298610 RepID=UPI0036405C8D